MTVLDPDNQPPEPDAAMWQQANEARIRQAVAALRQQEDGTLFSTLWQGHHVVVTKKDDRLRLWLLDENASATEWVQSDLDLANPLRLTMRYAQAMLLTLLWQPDPERVLVAGLGGGCLPLILHHHLPQVAIDCVEIAPPVAQLATEYFPLQPDDRLHITVDDAYVFLERQPPAVYDILFLDLFTDSGTTPSRLTSEEFYRLCRERMRPTGILTANLWSGSPEHSERMARLRSLFRTVRICHVYRSAHVVFATDAPSWNRFELMQKAVTQQQRRQFAFPFVQLVARLDEPNADDRSDEQ